MGSKGGFVADEGGEPGVGEVSPDGAVFKPVAKVSVLGLAVHVGFGTFIICWKPFRTVRPLSLVIISPFQYGYRREQYLSFVAMHATGWHKELEQYTHPEWHL